MAGIRGLTAVAMMGVVMTGAMAGLVQAMDSFSPVTELMLFSDEIMVMSATKRLQKLSEVPGSVTIITEKEIKERGALTIYEALTNMTGVSFANEGLFNTMRFRGMQASYNNKILVLVDGRKINEMDWGNYNGDFGTHLANVKQIEVIKGPGSSLYGANAYAGVINIVTKDGAEISGLSTEVSIGNKPGDFEVSQKYTMTYGTQNGDWDYKVSTSYWREKGIDPYNHPSPNNLFTGDQANFSLKWKDQWSLQGGYQRTKNPWNGSEWTPTPKNAEELEILYLDSTYTMELNDLSKVKLRISDNYDLNKVLLSEYWDLNRIKINSLSDLPSPSPVIIVTDTGEMQPIANAIGRYYIPFENFINLANNQALDVVALGRGQINEFMTDVQYDLSWPRNNYLLAGVNVQYGWSNMDYYNQPQVTDNNYAVYVQDEYHLGDQLILLSGLRYDYNQDYGSNLSPRESVIYEPVKGLRLKGLYGSAFRAPVISERYSETDYGFYEATGNINLKPENIQQSEASIEYELGKWLQAKAGYFYWETHNEIQFDYTYANLYAYVPDFNLIDPMQPHMAGLLYLKDLNVAPALVTWDNTNSRIGHGVELETILTPSDFTKLKLNYSRINLYARDIPGAPEWDQGIATIANAVLELHYKDLVFLNFYAHLSSSPTKNTNGGLDGNGYYIASKWLPLYDVSLGFNIDKFSLVAAAYNVFENPVAYDSAIDDYLKGQTLYRVNLGYTLKF